MAKKAATAKKKKVPPAKRKRAAKLEPPSLGELDDYLINEGRHQRMWEALGAHVVEEDGVTGVHFALWAPNASGVSVVGDFNYWNGEKPRDDRSWRNGGLGDFRFRHW